MMGTYVFGHPGRHMTRDEIRMACLCDDAIAHAYESFRSRYPADPVDDLWAVAHFRSGAEEACVVSKGRTFRWYEGTLTRKGWPSHGV